METCEVRHQWSELTWTRPAHKNPVHLLQGHWETEPGRPKALIIVHWPALAVPSVSDNSPQKG